MSESIQVIQMRQAFERTNSRDHRRQPPKGNNYIDPMAQADWESFQKGWQASREAVVIQMPDMKSQQYWEQFEDVEGESFVFPKYLGHLTASIKAQGLKVLP
ncbi:MULTISPECIES: hypothetical protein [Pseudomonas putida group]|uniref:hypothetical protein n=1 Tax=Pseudomonas putida group TaxID=136845 RepID=UPI001E65E01A|nr:hypothetical protein [Pseudomonas monteilii]MCE0961755.1 hypothetical protein [Pseudomonas putida]WJO31018.1 hypothetical protein LU690_18250 [Pseudomonas monteilii]